MRWGDPSWLPVAGGAVVLLAIVFALDLTRRRRLLERIGDVAQLQRMAASASTPRRVLKASLLVGAVALIALALARPQVEGRSDWRQRGIDVAIVIDFSKSMLARDVYPSRIERAKLEAEALIDSLAGDRVAVVAFAGWSVHYPLTTDYEAAKILFRGLTPLDLAPGSDLGEAVLTARCILRPDVQDPECERVGGGGRGGDPLDETEARLLRERRAAAREVGDRARAIVILSDGEATEGEVEREAEVASQLGIQIFTVGIGRPEGDRVPEFDRQGNEVGWKLTPDGKGYFISRLDEVMLKKVAALGGGENHYHREDPGRIGVEPLVRALSKLKEGDLEQRVVRQYGEAYQVLLFPAFLLLVIEACIPVRRRPRGRRKQEAA